jgi:hypothetical protein
MIKSVMKKAARKKKKKSFFEKETVVDNSAPAEIEQVDLPQANVERKDNRIKKIFAKKSVQIIIGVLIFLLIIGGGLYQYHKNNIGALGSAQGTDASDVGDLIAQVGEKMVLPTGETPTLATVSDVTKLQDQPFFKNAQNGDKVLIYGNAKLAIMYRPSIHKIVAVAPVNTPVTDVSTPATQSGNLSPITAAQKLKVLVLNSTKEVGLAKKGANLLNNNVADVSTGNAIGEYDTTTVSVVSKDKKISDQALQSLVSVYTKVKPTVISLPSVEKVPAGTDVVIILGSDFSENY